MKKFPIIPRAKIRLTISLLVMVAALFTFFLNMRFSIQFTGGMEVIVENSINAELVETALDNALIERGYADYTIGVGDKDGYGSLLLQIPVTEDDQVDELTNLVQDILLTTETIGDKSQIMELSIIGPSI